MNAKCYITGNPLKENEFSIIDKGKSVKINNLKEGLEYELNYEGWLHFSISRKQSYFTNPLFKEDEIRRIRAFIFNKNKRNEVPNISLHINADGSLKNDIPDIPSVYERAVLLLKYIIKNTRELGKHIPFNSKMVSLSYSLNSDEALYLLKNYLEKIGYISEHGQNCFIVTPEGFEKIEELKSTNTDTKKVFIIMPFDKKKKLEKLYESIKRTVEKDCGYQADRIDESLNNKKIDDEIIVCINRSRLVVCDLTPPDGGNQNGNVYFEAGYAMGRKIEIIWTCEQESIENLPFDIRQYRCISWSEGEMPDFEKRLKNIILSMLGETSK